MLQVQESHKNSSKLLALFPILTVVFYLFAAVILSSETGCKGAQVALGVKVDANCSEHAAAAKESPPPADLINLDCPQIGGSGTITVTLSRSSWMGMSGKGTKYLPDAGSSSFPGK